MDHNDREQFWKTLCSLPGNDIVAEREQLFKSIKYPKLLFRYRPVSTKSLEALRTNKLYFSSANYYDDPFDTFLHIDIEAIRKEYLSAFQTPESTETVVDGVKSLLGNILSEEQAAQFTVENVTNALSHGLMLSVSYQKACVPSQPSNKLRDRHSEPSLHKQAGHCRSDNPALTAGSGYRQLRFQRR